jgi:hypothetical protein
MAFIPPAMYASASGKYRVLMAGRSTMDQWFKSWNWPRLIHQHAIWRKWPIPYTKLAKAGVYLELAEVPTPNFTDDPTTNGQNMFDAVAQHADPSRFDAVFFKFCFIDFDAREMNAETRQRKLRQMTGLVEKVRAMTRQRGLKLILGTALPVQRPLPEAITLRQDFGAWVKDYARLQQDVAIVDLFGPLVDESGRMRPEFARHQLDDHVNWRGFRQLDPVLFESLTAVRNGSARR